MECRGDLGYSPFDCILFDLDDTLYSAELGLGKFLRKNIEEFLVQTCGITAEEACTLRAELFRKYGSSLIGLRALGYDIHPDDYHSYVHGRLPYEIIPPNPELRDLLQSIPLRKLIFTNSDRQHARRALQQLQILDCFQEIICFETVNPNFRTSEILLKPSKSVFEIAFSISKIQPERTLFVDDNEKNIIAGKALNLRTALVGRKMRNIKEADYLLTDICELREVVTEIWGGDLAAEKDSVVSPPATPPLRHSFLPSRGKLEERRRSVCHVSVTDC